MDLRVVGAGILEIWKYERICVKERKKMTRGKDIPDDLGKKGGEREWENTFQNGEV